MYRWALVVFGWALLPCLVFAASVSKQPVAKKDVKHNLCAECGVVRAINTVQSNRAVAVPPALKKENAMPGGPDVKEPIGFVINKPIGKTDNETFVGGIGSEAMQERMTEQQTELVIKMDTGALQLVTTRDDGAFHVGDRVKVVDGKAELLP